MSTTLDGATGNSLAARVAYGRESLDKNRVTMPVRPMRCPAEGVSSRVRSLLLDAVDALDLAR